VKAGVTERTWSAQFDTQNCGLRVHMLGGHPTQVFTGSAQGAKTTRLPMLMARRSGADTMFAAVLDPFRGKPDVTKVTRLASRADRVSDIQASGLVVRTPAGRALFAVSFTERIQRLGDMTLDGSIGAAAVGQTGNLQWLYLLDGRSVSCAGATLSMSGAYDVTIRETDDEATTVTVQEPLPDGDTLKGSPLILDLPYNECYAVAKVTRHAKGSKIHLEGLPNLYFRPGMTAKVPNRAFVRALRKSVLEVSANGPLDIHIPRPRKPRRIHFRDARGRVGELPVNMEDGRVLLRFAAPPQKTLVVFDLEGASDLKDGQPPRIVKLIVDGREVPPATNPCLPFRPRKVTLVLSDDTGVDPGNCTVVVNGRKPSPSECRFRLSDAKGRRSVLTVADTPLPISFLEVTVRDKALLGNELKFMLETAPPLEVIPMKKASGGHAVRLLKPTASLRGEVTLPKGDYEVNVIARAPSDGANSLWLDLDGERMSDAIHIRTDGFGNSSRHYALPPDLSQLTVKTDGKHTFLLTLREAPGPELDKIQFLRDGQIVCELECEALSEGEVARSH